MRERKRKSERPRERERERENDRYVHSKNNARITTRMMAQPIVFASTVHTVHIASVPQVPRVCLGVVCQRARMRSCLRMRIQKRMLEHIRTRRTHMVKYTNTCNHTSHSHL